MNDKASYLPDQLLDQQCIHPGVSKLKPYQPGKAIESLAREIGFAPESICKLASNENPHGISASVQEAIIHALPTINRYPEGNGTQLKADLSEHLGITPEQITLGNGSNEILDLIAQTFLQIHDSVLYSAHAFAIYPLVTQAVGAQGIEIPAQNWAHDLSAFAEKIHQLNATNNPPKLIFLANPNNPTGTWFNTQALEHLLEATNPKHTLVVLDEAYFEYVNKPDYPNGMHYLNKHPNLIVTRTFSKAYGLAGLRLGYAISHPHVAQWLNARRAPFNVNNLALVAGQAALADNRFLTNTVTENTQALQRAEQWLKKQNIDFIPSVANFITINTQRGGQWTFEALLKQGIIIRPIDNYGLPKHIRVSFGTRTENERFFSSFLSLYHT